MNQRLTIWLTLVRWTLLLLTLAWSLWFVFAGMGNHMDPLYWLYKYEHMEGGWMAAGTILFGSALVRLFGVRLLLLRLVAWLSVFVAVLCPYCVLLTREQRLANIHWLALAFGMMGYGAFQELSPGTLTVLLLSVTATVAVAWLRRPSVGQLIGLGLVAGVAITVRFPNILVLPVLLTLIIVTRWQTTRRWVHPALLLLSVVAVAALIYGLAALLLSPAPMDAAMNSHQFSRILTALWTKGALLAGYAVLWLGIGAVPFLLKQWEENRWVWPLAGLMTGALLFYYVWYVPLPRQWYNIDLTYMLSAGLLMWTAATRRRENGWMAAVIIVAALGTDVGWLKLFPAVIVLLPSAVAYTESSIRRWLWPVMLGLTAAVMLRFTTNSIGGSNLSKSRVTCSAAPYTGIRVTEQETEYMAQIKSDYAVFGDTVPVLAVGSDLHLMRALTGCKAACYNEFWSNIFDSVYTARYQPVVAQRKPVVFCFFSPQFRTKSTYRHRHSAFEEMLRAEGYEEVDRGRYRYMIYLPGKRNN